MRPGPTHLRVCSQYDYPKGFVFHPICMLQSTEIHFYTNLKYSLYDKAIESVGEIKTTDNRIKSFSLTDENIQVKRIK